MAWENFRFIDLFCGIGGIRIPFDELGGECVFSSDIDEYAQITYKANFGDKPHGDITKIKASDIPDHDILLAGFPCQAFSIMGLMKGFEDTRGTLFFDIERILAAKQPHAFLLENVKNLKSHDKGRTFKVIIQRLKELGYYVHWKVLNALDFGLPQKRERTIIVGFKENYVFNFPKSLDKKPDLKEILEDDKNIDRSYFANEQIVKKRMEKVANKTVFYPSIWHENKAGNISVLPYSCALRAGASYNYLLVNGIRRPTSRELLRLQGFPETYKIVLSYSHIRKQTGNSVPVNVIRAVAQEMLKSLRRGEIVRESNQLNLEELSVGCR